MSKVLIEKDNDENVPILRNLLYKFAKLHNYKVEMIINEQRVITFVLVDSKNENK